MTRGENIKVIYLVMKIKWDNMYTTLWFLVIGKFSANMSNKIIIYEKLNVNKQNKILIS